MGRRRAALAAVLTAGFSGEFAFAFLLLPLLQHYLPVVRGLSAAMPGYILAIYGFSRLLAQVPLGAIADFMDRRLAVALGYLAALVSGLLFWPPVPVVVLFLAAAVFGLGHALADPLIPTGLAEGTNQDGRGRILALLNLAQVAGLVTGLGGGAFVVDLAPASTGFVVVAVANALTLLLLVASAPVLRQSERSATRPQTKLAPLRSLLSERVGFLLCTLFMLALAVNLLMPDLNLFVVSRLHSSLHVMTLYLIPAALVGVAALPLGGWIADRAGRLPPLLGGAGMAAMALLVLAHVSVPWQAAIATTLAAAGVAVTMPASNAALLDLADPNYRAVLLSSMMALQGLAEAVGPFLSGLFILIGGAVAPVAAASLSLWLVVPCTVLYASSPRGNQQGEIVAYTPLTRFISRAHLRAHALHLERRSQQPTAVVQRRTAKPGE
jgi:DHA1 family multidrug resistance protein-like MFS transporter